MASLPDRYARSTPPESTAELRDIVDARGREHASPVVRNVRRALAALADRAAIDGLDPREQLKAARDSLVSAVDDALLDELNRWQGVRR